LLQVSDDLWRIFITKDITTARSYLLQATNAYSRDTAQRRAEIIGYRYTALTCNNALRCFEYAGRHLHEAPSAATATLVVLKWQHAGRALTHHPHAQPGILLNRRTHARARAAPINND